MYLENLAKDSRYPTCNDIKSVECGTLTIKLFEHISFEIILSQYSRTKTKYLDCGEVNIFRAVLMASECLPIHGYCKIKARSIGTWRSLHALVQQNKGRSTLSFMSFCCR